MSAKSIDQESDDGQPGSETTDNRKEASDANDVQLLETSNNVTLKRANSENIIEARKKTKFSLRTLFVTTTMISVTLAPSGSLMRYYGSKPDNPLESDRFRDDLKSLNEKSSNGGLSSIQELHLRYALLEDASRVEKKYRIPIKNFFHGKEVRFSTFSSQTGKVIENALQELEILTSAEKPLNLDTAEGRKAAETIKTLRAAARMQKNLIQDDKATTLTPRTIKEILGKTIQRLLIDWDGKSPLNNGQLYYISKNISGLLIDFPENEVEQAAKDLLENEFAIVLNDEEWGAFWEELKPEIQISHAAFEDDESSSTGDVASR